MVEQVLCICMICRVKEPNGLLVSNATRRRHRKQEREILHWSNAQNTIVLASDQYTITRQDDITSREHPTTNQESFADYGIEEEPDNQAESKNEEEQAEGEDEEEQIESEDEEEQTESENEEEQTESEEEEEQTETDDDDDETEEHEEREEIDFGKKLWLSLNIHC